MEFDVVIAGREPDCCAIQTAIHPIDPAAVIVASSGEHLRLFTLLDVVQLIAFLGKLGYSVTKAEARSASSVCIAV